MGNIQFDVTTQNARLDALETAWGPSPTLVFLSGSAPTTTTAAETGTRLAVMSLPADYMANAASGSKSLQGTWQDASADASGTIGYARLYDSSSVCRAQLKITATGTTPAGAIVVSSLTITAGQPFSIVSFTITDSNGGALS